MVTLSDVTRTYERRRGAVQALDHVSLQVAAGEFLVVRGPSGSGKSTLLLTMAGMIRPTSGGVSVGGQDLYQLGGMQRARFRAENVGFVFQMFHLVPYLSVLENVLLPARLVRNGNARSEALGLLERLGMQERLEHRPAELSTGERQRTAIARALINNPALLLADEPTGNLDHETGQEVIGYLSEFQRSGKTVIVVTHDPAMDQHAGRVVHLRGGQIVSNG